MKHINAQDIIKNKEVFGSVNAKAKGLATSAVFRSSVFQINFLGLAKFVAINSPAPESGR